jgi:alpha-beta hydrolase superfamily lysophospholipase
VSSTPIDFITADGTRLHAQRWDPPGEPKFVVVLVHGQAEHVGRYDEMATRWSGMGGVVFGPDHRGQGKSGGAPGHVDDFSQYASDLRALMLRLATESEALSPQHVPWFLFGHSMGGLITLTYLLDYPDDDELPLRGAVVSAPLLGIVVPVHPAKKIAAKLLLRVAPRLGIDPGMPASTISRDAEEVEIYANDPRRIKVVTSGWANAMERGIERAKREVHKIRLPMLWYVGSGDLICDHLATVEAFGKLAQASSRDQTLRVFEGYYHELHNEPASLRAPVHEMLDSWIAERLATGGPEQ